MVSFSRFSSLALVTFISGGTLRLPILFSFMFKQILSASAIIAVIASPVHAQTIKDSLRNFSVNVCKEVSDPWANGHCVGSEEGRREGGLLITCYSEFKQFRCREHIFKFLLQPYNGVYDDDRVFNLLTKYFHQ